MRFIRMASIALTLLVIVPAAAYAQASITGVVKDTSGAVLPGVTVEAGSPVLIERVRTALTDGTGQYRIVDLRPGVYTVTFTLTGFSTIRREGIELAGAFTATVNADLRVGSLAETITVSGETPIVDVQSARREATIDGDTLIAIPSARTYTNIISLVPGVITSTNNLVQGPGMVLFGIHGGPTTEGRLQVDGINVGASLGGSGVSGYSADVANAQEIAFTTSGSLGEAEVGGPVMNVVPRTGGNMVKGSLFANGANSAMQGSNFTQALRDAGLTVPGDLIKAWDISGALGGPVWKDRLWYFASVRHTFRENYVGGMFYNLNAGDPTKWTYEPDLTRQARNDAFYRSYALRLTLQVTPRNKLNLFWDEQPTCSNCTWGGGATTAPEASGTSANRVQHVQQASWTSTLGSRVLVEGGFGTYLTRWGTEEHRLGNPTRDLIGVTEQGGIIPGLTYRSQTWFNAWIGAHTWRASTSYVTGAHNMKVGYQGAFHEDDSRNFTNTQRLAYRFNNGVPNQLTMSALPFEREQRTLFHAAYVQDQSTFGRLTLQGGLRYDHAWSYFPAQQIGPELFVPIPLVFPRTDGVRGFDDITVRTGMAYNLSGDGKTALKVNVGKYLQPASNIDRYTATNPVTRVATSTARSWTDANQNFAADCNLLNPAANNECGAMASQTFGMNVFSSTYDPAILGGWGVRGSDWQVGASIQQELLPRVSAEVGYYRRWWGNLDATDNRAVGPTDYSPYSIVAPADSRLPGGGSYVINDLYDINPGKFGQLDNFRTAAHNFGNQLQYWHGVDVTVNARMRNGLTVQGGTSTGRPVTDSCDVIIDNPSRRNCHVVEPFQTQLRGLAVYTIPKVDVQLSTTFQSKPGVQLAANYTVASAVVQQTLGRPLAGSAANVTVNLLNPGQLYGDRINQLDLRVGKILRYGKTRTQVTLDFYNALNSAAVLAYNQTFGARWLTPTSVLTARFARISAQLDF